MDIIVEILEISIVLIVLATISKYIVYLLSLFNLIVPPFIAKFIFLAIAISVVQYIIARKDD